MIQPVESVGVAFVVLVAIEVVVGGVVEAEEETLPAVVSIVGKDFVIKDSIQ